MKAIVFLFVLLTATFGMLKAQQTRREVTNPSSAEDSKPDSKEVPEVYSIPANFQRVLIARLKHGTDLLSGLDSIVARENIRNAVILAGIGSVTNYHVHSVSNRTFPTKNIFVKDTSASADLASMNGYIIKGRIHAHVVFTNGDKAFGGHLEHGTQVFTFAIVTIGVLDDKANPDRIDDSKYR